MKNNIAAESNSYLSFKVGGELFAAHVSKVLNILELEKITKVPQAPDYMLGVINLRGSVLPVVDSRIKFGMPVNDIKDGNCIVVNEIQLDSETVKVGALVDSVEEVMEVEQKDILDPPSIGKRYHTEFISGVVKKDENFIMILDMNKVYSIEEVSIFNESTKQKNEEKNIKT